MGGLVIGLDLNDNYTQICCYDKEKSQTIPTVIYRRKEEEVWLLGEKVYTATLLGEGVIVDKLLKMAAKDGTSTIGNICYGGGTLLKLLIEKMLDYPRKEFGTDEMTQLVITLQNVDCRLLDTLIYCANYLEVLRDRVHVTSHTEGFIYYVLSQKRELWANQVGLFELSSEYLCYYETEVQRGMRRNTVQAGTQNQKEALNLDILDSPSGSRLADKILTTCGEKLLNKKPFSTVFPMGKGFEHQDWTGGFMRLICDRRKVFMEFCLFIEGAVYKGADYTYQETSYPYVLICKGRLKTEVSLKIMRRGRENQLVVAPYGDNWCGSKSLMDLIVDERKEIGFTINPLDSKRKKLIRIPLIGFPGRPPKTIRTGLRVAFTDEGTMTMPVHDKRLRELFPSSNAVMKQEVKL